MLECQGTRRGISQRRSTGRLRGCTMHQHRARGAAHNLVGDAAWHSAVCAAFAPKPAHRRRTFEYNGAMARPQPSPFPFPPKRLYGGANVPMRVIRRYARAIAEEFQPERIILFGSYAYGTPHEDSDVDLLVVMPAYSQHTQSVRIQWRLAAPFPLDLIVRTPKETASRLAEKESFLTEIMARGKVLYEKTTRE